MSENPASLSPWVGMCTRVRSVGLFRRPWVSALQTSHVTAPPSHLDTVPPTTLSDSGEKSAPVLKCWRWGPGALEEPGSPVSLILRGLVLPSEASEFPRYLSSGGTGDFMLRRCLVPAVAQHSATASPLHRVLARHQLVGYPPLFQGPGRDGHAQLAFPHPGGGSGRCSGLSTTGSPRCLLFKGNPV